jgi:hypothetical protein
MALWKKNEVTVDLANYRYIFKAPPKFGKTTFFVDLVKKLYGSTEFGLLCSIGNEKGYKAIPDVIVADCPTWGDLMDVVNDLVENRDEYSFRLVALDTIDELIAIAINEVIRLDWRQCGEKRTINSAFGGYGAGRKKVEELVNSVITKISEANLGIVFLGHTKIKTLTPKVGEAYDMLTSNLSSDYSKIFENKADMIITGVIEREVENGLLQDESRWLVFRGDNFVDAGSRFADIVDRVPFTTDNFITAVKDAIKSAIGDRATDKYLEEKAKQEQKEREDYYHENKERLLKEDPNMADVESEVDTCEQLKVEIKAAITNLDAETKKGLQAKLKAAGLPIQYQKVTDTDTLAKILSIVAE